MANHGPNYGLDADLQVKRRVAFDPALEADLKGWIESTTGERLVPSFNEGLKSGVVLCKLVNHYKPGMCKFSTARAAFPMMENIESFLNACRKLGVPVPDLFMTVDLYEAKNINQVHQTLSSLRRILTGTKYTGPTPAPPHAIETTPPPPPPRSTPAVTHTPTPSPSPSTTSSAAAKFCPNCGTKNPGAKFCPNCGTKL
ncbi:Muscle-specific protein 20 [Pelomyxa schiedti]|nr:Muscle-specific protein 20 [Pelomyxa schiedti]